MKFLVDTQLPRRLASWMREQGHDTIHTLDLPRGNRTLDSDLNRISLEERRDVVTKDADFVTTFLVRQAPWKLRLVSTGNISHKELTAIFSSNFPKLLLAFEEFNFVELNDAALIFHY